MTKTTITNRSTFSVLPYINKQKVKADGTTNILCRITIDGKSTALSTGISCAPQDWNAKKGEIRNVRDNGRLASFLTEVKDRKYIRNEREKTGVEFFVPIHPIAEKILSLYNTTDDSKPVFPLGDKKDIYNDVHTLGVMLGISSKLGFHASRHTFGVLMLNEGIPIGSIAKMMGHADITSTQVYAQVTEQKISSDMDKLIAKRAKDKNPMA